MAAALGLRYRADYRALFYVFVLMPGVPLAQFFYPQLVGWMLPLGLYLGFSAGVLTHNQNHCPTFKGKGANTLYSAFLSVFYGYPIFGWVPTHNQNHHKYVNRPGDASITWRVFKTNRTLSALTYFFISSYHQGQSIKEYLHKARTSKPELYRQAMLQYAAVILGHLGFVALGVAMHGWARGLVIYAIAVLIPALFSTWSMFFINYIQHVDCDAWSKVNHSRNFVGPVANYLVFNAGLHLAHHEQPGLHWSKLPELHAKLAPNVAPELNQKSILWFIFSTYVLGPFFPRFRTKMLGRPPWETATEAVLATAPVAAEGAGFNEMNERSA